MGQQTRSTYQVSLSSDHAADPRDSEYGEIGESGRAWLTTAYAVIAVVLNLITRSSAERALWAPASIVLLGLITFVMVATHHNDVTPEV